MHFDRKAYTRARRIVFPIFFIAAAALAHFSAQAQDISTMSPTEVKARTKQALADRRALCDANPECKAASDAKKDAAARKRLAKLLEENERLADSAGPSSH